MNSTPMAAEHDGLQHFPCDRPAQSAGEQNPHQPPDARYPQQRYLATALWSTAQFPRQHERHCRAAGRTLAVGRDFELEFRGASYPLSGRSTITGGTTITPDIAGNFPKNTGGVIKVSNGVSYFSGLTQVADRKPTSRRCSPPKVPSPERRSPIRKAIFFLLIHPRAGMAIWGSTGLKDPQISDST